MPSHADTIQAANRALLVDRELDSVEHMVHGAFSSLQVEVDVLVQDADRVAWQRRCVGRQDGSFQGFPATGRETVWRDMIVSRFHDGRIAEEWVVTDLAERLMRARKG